MPSLRSILSIILVLVTTLLVSCGNPQTSKIPTTYSPEKIAQLEVFVTPIEAAKEQFSVLKGFISEENWVDTRTYIHGPMGALRQNMLNLSRNLLPKDQKQATSLAREVFGHLERLDTAAEERTPSLVEVQYKEALKDFNAFLDLIPQA
jgi:photosystem II protein PsbQ